jgi:hypothetical protein
LNSFSGTLLSPPKHRGRGALRPFAASAQIARTAVSLLPPHAADGNNPPLSVQTARNPTQAAISAVQQETIRDIQRMVQQDQERAARLGQEAIASVVAGESTNSTDPPPVRESAARPQDDTSLVDIIPGVAIPRSAVQLHQADLAVAQDESRRINADIVAESRATASEARQPGS